VKSTNIVIFLCGLIGKMVKILKETCERDLIKRRRKPGSSMAAAAFAAVAGAAVATETPRVTSFFLCSQGHKNKKGDGP